jgi:hypothetical protein
MILDILFGLVCWTNIVIVYLDLYVRQVCWPNNVIVYLDLYVGFLHKILYFLSNCLSKMKIDNCSIFRNTYLQWFINRSVANNSTMNNVS